MGKLKTVNFKNLLIEYDGGSFITLVGVSIAIKYFLMQKFFNKKNAI